MRALQLIPILLLLLAVPLRADDSSPKPRRMTRAQVEAEAQRAKIRAIQRLLRPGFGDTEIGADDKGQNGDGGDGGDDNGSGDGGLGSGFGSGSGGSGSGLGSGAGNSGGTTSIGYNDNNAKSPDGDKINDLPKLPPQNEPPGGPPPNEGPKQKPIVKAHWWPMCVFVDPGISTAQGNQIIKGMI